MLTIILLVLLDTICLLPPAVEANKQVSNFFIVAIYYAQCNAINALASYIKTMYSI